LTNTKYKKNKGLILWCTTNRPWFWTLGKMDRSS